MTKTSSNSFIRRSQLETNDLKTKTHTDLKLHKKQNIICIKLYITDLLGHSY